MKTLTRRSLPVIFSALISLGLSACGSGGSSQGGTTAATAQVPATSSTGSTTTPVASKDPASLVKSTLDAASSSAQLSLTSSMGAVSGSGVTEKSIGTKSISTSLDCASSVQLSGLCVGSFSLSTNLSSGQTGIPAGTVITIGYSGFRVLSAPPDTTASGNISLSFVDAFTSPNALNGTARVRVDTTLPLPEVHTDMALTFRNLAVQGSGSDLTLTGGADATATGQEAVSINFNRWHMIGSRAQPGSSATISSATETATITVVSASATQTSFDVLYAQSGGAAVTRRVVQNIVNGQAVYTLQ